jgi:hypothetical protein
LKGHGFSRVIQGHPLFIFVSLLAYGEQGNKNYGESSNFGKAEALPPSKQHANIP